MAKVGDRVKLLRAPEDEWTLLTLGDTGTVTLVDDMGTVHVKWDSGSSLGLIPGEDAWEVIECST